MAATYVDSPVDDDLAARFNGANGASLLDEGFVTTTTRTLSRYMMFDSGTHSRGNTVLIAVMDGGTDAYRAQATLRSDKKFALRDHAEVTVATTNYLMVPDKLYRLVWKLSGSSQSLEVRDGLSDDLIEVISGSCDDTGFNLVREGLVSNPSGNIALVLDRCIDDDTITDIPPYAVTPPPAGGQVLSVSVWDGSQRLPATVKGVWNGSEIVSGNIRIHQ